MVPPPTLKATQNLTPQGGVAIGIGKNIIHIGISGRECAYFGASGGVFSNGATACEGNSSRGFIVKVNKVDGDGLFDIFIFPIACGGFDLGGVRFCVAFKVGGGTIKC
jgi:hypothetical protein